MMRASRDLSLDAFRGLTVFLMILVNLQGSSDHIYPLLEHAEWNGLTLADLVFPWFLLIVGLSIPLALDGKADSSHWPGVLKRSLMLILLGIALAWLIRPRFELEQIRMAGVLQRIGVVYLAAAGFALWKPGWRLAAIAALLAFVAHSWLLLKVPAPGVLTPSLVAGEGISGWLDTNFLPGRVYRKTWDPEGILSTLPAIGSSLVGVGVMRWSKMAGDISFKMLALIGLILLLAGLAFAQFVPVNKALWTASFALLTAGSGLFIWAGLRAGWPVIGQKAVARLLVLLGQTALTFYVLHMLLLAFLVRKIGGDVRIWELLFDGLSTTGLPLAFSSMLFAIIAGGLCILPLPWLKRRGWLIKA